MFFVRSSVCMMATAVLLAACAESQLSVPQQAASQQALAAIKTIAVMPSPEPENYIYRTDNNFEICPVRAGMLAVAGLRCDEPSQDQADEQQTVTQLLEDQREIPFSVTLAEAVADRLRQQGFESRVEPSLWESVDDDDGYIIWFENIQTDADAVLIIGHDAIGFIDGKPTILVNVQLLGPDHKSLIYRGFHATGWHPKGEGWHYISTGKRFGGFRSLTASPDKTADALNEAARRIAASIADDLKRQNPQ